MLMYGFVWTALFLGVAFVISTIGLMLGGTTVAKSVMFPTVLLLVAMFTTSLYFTFRDSFRADGEVEPAQAEPAGEGPP